MQQVNETANPNATLQRSVSERFFHAVLFESIAIGICAPLGAWLLDYPLAHIGLLTLMLSTIAMSWTMFFNAAFDRAQLRMGFKRTLSARVTHAVLLEIGLILVAVPLAAWWLDMSLWRAFVLDIGIVMFFLPYTFVFNLCYDRLRERVMARKYRLAAKKQRGLVIAANKRNKRTPRKLKVIPRAGSGTF